MPFIKDMWACWTAILERFCHREGDEAKCSCYSNCCDTIVICRSESRVLNDCLPKHVRGESDRSGQYHVANEAPVPPAVHSDCVHRAPAPEPVPELQWPY